MKMEIARVILEFVAAISWPAVVLAIIVMLKTPILELLRKFGDIVERGKTESFDIALGETFRISFKEAIHKANPQTVEEVVQIAEREGEKAISTYSTLKKIPWLADYDVNGEYLREIKEFALTKAEQNKWKRPEMHFKEKDVAASTKVPLRDIHPLLTILQSRGVLKRINRTGDGEWIAIPQESDRG